MAQPAQQILGIASGFDTASIIKALMTAESTAKTKLEEKKSMFELRLEAYRAVNNLFSIFQQSINNLSKADTWSGKIASSSNESVLLATANKYALEGAHSFRVAQLASTAQYMSKGFADATAAKVSPSQAGVIRIDSVKSRVDNTAQLSSFNNGLGVYRGSIRITDGEGRSTLVDLSAAMSAQDAIDAINGSGANVRARVNDAGDGLLLENLSGQGSIRVQNYGGGSTATDLGLAGEALDGADLVGKSVYQLAGETRLADIRDGLGLDKGTVEFSIKNGNETQYITVNLVNCQTVDDVLAAFNTAIGNKQQDIDAANKRAPGTYATDLSGLSLGIDAANGRLVFNGMNENYIYNTGVVRTALSENQLNDYAESSVLKQLGLEMHNVAGATGYNGDRVFGQIDSPMLKNISGVNAQGVGGAASGGATVKVDLTGDTLLRALNGGAGLDCLRSGMPNLSITYNDGVHAGIDLTISAADDLVLAGILSNANSTVDDLLAHLNAKLVDVPGLEFAIDASKTGIVLNGVDPKAELFLDGSLARDLTGSVGNHFPPGVPSYRELDLAVEKRENAVDPLSVTLQDIYPDGYAGGRFINGAGDLLNSSQTFEIQIGDNEKIVFRPGLDAEIGVESTLDALLNGAGGFEGLNDVLQRALDEAGYAPGSMAFSLSADGKRLVVEGLGASGAPPEITISGDVARNLGIAVDYNLADVNDPAKQGTLPPVKDIRASVAGYYERPDIDGATLVKDLTAADGGALDLSQPFIIKTGASAIEENRFDIQIDLSDLAGDGALAVDDLLDALNQRIADAIQTLRDHGETGLPLAIAYKLNDAGTGFVLDDFDMSFFHLKTSGGLAASLGVDMDIAAGTTTAAYQDMVEAKNADLRPKIEHAYPIEGLGEFEFTFTQTGGTTATVTLSTAGLNADSTLNDLIRHLNQQLKDLGTSVDSQVDLAKLQFRVNDNGNGLAVDNYSGKAIDFTDHAAHGLAGDLGFAGKTVSHNGYLNGGNLDRKYIDRSSLLADLNGGAGVPAGKVHMVLPNNVGYEIDLSGCKTIGDVIDVINSYGMDIVTARVNDTGDGIVIEQREGADGYADSVTGAWTAYTGNIRFYEVAGGSTAMALGLLGEGSGGEAGLSRLDARFERFIEVGKDDTLQDLMFRIDESGAPVTTSIINDGNAAAPYRLVLTADKSGAMGDFVLDTDLTVFGMRKTAQGQDSVLLYGGVGTLGGPVALTSSTNTNNSAVMGLSLEMKQTSAEYTTVTVGQDKAGLVDDITALVQAFNDLHDLIGYLDNYNDPETGEPSILFGDTNLRRLLDEVSDLFFGVYYADGSLNMNGGRGATAEQRASAKTWYGIGVSFDDSGKLQCDLDVLNDAINNDFNGVRDFMAATRDVARTDFGATSFFNGQAADGFGIETAINGNTLGSAKPFKALEAMTANSNNEYTVMFNGARNLSRVSLYHPNSADEPAADYSLNSFVVEYMDAHGVWQELRSVTNNTQSANYFGFAAPTQAQGVRVRAVSTNAPDGVFRLLEIECEEDEGLAGAANRVVNTLGDSISGFWALWQEEVNGQIADLKAAIEKQDERLDKVETRLYQQYTAMETALSQLQGQGDYFSTMMDAWSSATSKKK